LLRLGRTAPAVGAPPELVCASQAATADETEHAHLAFALASAYAGRGVGPTALEIQGSLDGFSVHELLAMLVREGCIGETVAAIEASEALDAVRDPVVRGVLETVARDELLHAELSWQTVGWLIMSGRVDRETVRVELERALSDVARLPTHQATPDDLMRFGIVSDRRRDELRRVAASSVLSRCAEALVGCVHPQPNWSAPPA
jgi:hypothetical protein